MCVCLLFCVKEPQISLDTWRASFRCSIIHVDGRGSLWHRRNNLWSCLNERIFYLQVHRHELGSFPSGVEGVAIAMLLAMMFAERTKPRAVFYLLPLICEQKKAYPFEYVLATYKCVPYCPRWVRVYIPWLLGCRNHNKTSGTQVKGCAKAVTFWIKQVPLTGIVILPVKIDSILYVPLR